MRSMCLTVTVSFVYMENGDALFRTAFVGNMASSFMSGLKNDLHEERVVGSRLSIVFLKRYDSSVSGESYMRIDYDP